MKETTKVVSQKEALEKYQNITHRGDGTCEVRVRVNDDGEEDSSSWNMNYRNKKESESKKNEKPSNDSSNNDSDGDPKWVCCIFSIIPLLEIYWIIKAVIGLVLWPLRCIFCCNCNYPKPSYNFSKW
ncbi:MAG: hypothetical protein K2K47_03755 [Duncaniella sp.]|nr:hypothetical protein [Duncaniella sp.]